MDIDGRKIEFESYLDDLNLLKKESIPNPAEDLEEEEIETIMEHFPEIYEATAPFLVNPISIVHNDLALWCKYIREKQNEMQQNHEAELKSKLDKNLANSDYTELTEVSDKWHSRIQSHLQIESTSGVLVGVEWFYNYIAPTEMYKWRVLEVGGNRTKCKLKDQQIEYAEFEGEVLHKLSDTLSKALTIKIEALENSGGSNDTINPDSLPKLKWDGEYDGHIQSIPYALVQLLERNYLRRVDGKKLRKKDIYKWFNAMFDVRVNEKTINKDVQEYYKRNGIKSHEDFLLYELMIVLKKEFEEIYSN